MIIHDKGDVGSYAGVVVLYDGNADKDNKVCKGDNYSVLM